MLGVTEANVRQYMLELMYAVVAGQLPAAKFAVGLRASGVKLEAQSPDVLVQLLWCAASGSINLCVFSLYDWGFVSSMLSLEISPASWIVGRCLHQAAGKADTARKGMYQQSSDMHNVRPNVHAGLCGHILPTGRQALLKTRATWLT